MISIIVYFQEIKKIFETSILLLSIRDMVCTTM